MLAALNGGRVYFFFLPFFFFFDIETVSDNEIVYSLKV